jgi:hypothetical protein
MFGLSANKWQVTIGYNILNKSQYGIRKNESTNDAITTIIENIIESLDDKTKCNWVLLVDSTWYSYG